MFHCEYAGKPAGPRYEFWREEYARHWLSTDFDPLGTGYLANEATASEHSFLALCNMRSTPVRMARRSNALPDAAGARYLIMSKSPLQARQHGRAVEVPAGQVVLLSGDDPAELVQLADGDRWSIRIWQKLLNETCRNVDDKIARPIDAPRELTQLLLHQIETAQRVGSKLDAPANQVIAQHVLDLGALCLGANADAAHLADRRGLAAARLDAIKADILLRLTKPDTTLGRIAARYGLSTRYIQYLFELSGTSFTAFILEHRLLLAHRLLRDPNNRWRKVSDIANTAGFADVSYFNRAFKNRFDATPTDIRGSSDERV
jgi:AraC-like DNA-binding protein